MTLKERYLKAVAAQLSRDTRDDIIAELDDLIMTRMEAREAELDRPLTEADEEAVLREIGHPLSVAAQYGSGPQHVVGPELYPWWMFGVKVSLTAMIILNLIGAALHVLTVDQDVGQAIGQMFANAFSGGVTIIGFATLAGFILERQKARPLFLREWRVKDLGFFELAAMTPLDWFNPDKWEDDKAGRGMSGRRWTLSPTAHAIGAAAGWTVIVLWWAGLLNIGGMGLERLGAWGGVDWSNLLLDLWRLLYWPGVVYGVANVVFNLTRAFRPVGARATALADVGFALARLAMFVWLWALSPLAPLIREDTVQGFAERAQSVFQNNGWTTADLVMIFVAFCILQTVWQVAEAAWRFATGRWSRGCGEGRTASA